MNEEIDTKLLFRYEIIQKIGKGGFGVVWKAIDLELNKLVIIKKIFGAFQTDSDSQRTYREIFILREFNHHQNIITLLRIYISSNEKDVYLIFEYMETDLHAVLIARVLEESQRKFIFYQILKTLKFIHSANVIHRDIKPSNIFINRDCKIKIGDFGLARTIRIDDSSNSMEPIMTDNIATRWYRAPEILLASKNYNKMADIWSVGCVLAELIAGKVLFPGSSSLNQIEKILEFTGLPNKQEEISNMNSEIFDVFLNNLQHIKKKTLNYYFQVGDEDAIDLVVKMICFNPKDRIKIEDALNHKYFREFRKEGEEQDSFDVLAMGIDDSIKLASLAYKEAIYKIMSSKSKKVKNYGKIKKN